MKRLLLVMLCSSVFCVAQNECANLQTLTAARDNNGILHQVICFNPSTAAVIIPTTVSPAASQNPNGSGYQQGLEAAGATFIISPDGTVTSPTQTDGHPGLSIGDTGTAAIRPALELNNTGTGNLGFEQHFRVNGADKNGFVWDRQQLGLNDIAIRDFAHSQSGIYINHGSGGTTRIVNIGGSDAESAATSAITIVNQRVKITDQGSCTMAAGTCTAQALNSTYTAAPNCFANWTGTGTLTGIVKVPSTTTNVTPASSVGTDTAVVNWFCFGN